MKTNALLLIGTVAVLLTGCVSTFREVQPLSNAAPPASRPSVLVLEEVKITDARLSEPELKMMQLAFQLGVQKWCLDHAAFESHPRKLMADVPSDAVVLSSTITEVEKGSEAARFWVGMGAGQARVQGCFQLANPDGTPLIEFRARKSYLGGSGIGGFDMISIEQLTGQLGQLAAETTDKWYRGEALE